jgi:membrane protein
MDSFLYDSKVALLSFGLLLTLFFASSGMMGLIRSFNKKHYVGIQRKMGLMLRLNAIKLTIIIFGLFLACFILLISQGALLKWLIKDRYWRDIFSYTRWIFLVMLIFYTIGFIFRYAPSFEKKWKLMSPGSIVTTFLILLSSYIFSVFVDNFGRYNVLYGSIGTLMMIMALIYINSLAIIIGFELNVSINSIQIISKQRIENEKRQKETEDLKNHST